MPFTLPKDRVGGVDLVRRADGLLHEGEIPAHQPTDGPSRLHRAGDVAAEPRRGARGGERGEHGRRRDVARAGNQVVHRGAVKGAQSGQAHQPQVQHRDVRVADERLRVRAEQLGIEIRQHAHSAVAARAADHRLHPRIEPHLREAGGAALVLGALVAARRRELGIDEDAVAGTLERAYAPRKPSGARGVGGGDDTDRVPLLERRGAEHRGELSHALRGRRSRGCPRRRPRRRDARRRRRAADATRDRGADAPPRPVRRATR